MSDQQLRALERKAEAGDVEAHGRLMASRRRAGRVPAASPWGPPEEPPQAERALRMFLAERPSSRARWRSFPGTPAALTGDPAGIEAWRGAIRRAKRDAHLPLHVYRLGGGVTLIALGSVGVEVHLQDGTAFLVRRRGPPRDFARRGSAVRFPGALLPLCTVWGAVEEFLGSRGVPLGRRSLAANWSRHQRAQARSA